MVAVDIRKADKVAGEWGMFLSFPYDEQLIAVVRGLPSRYWHSEQKEWEVPLKNLTELVNQMSNYEVQITGELGALVEKKVPEVEFDFKTKPFDHQIEGFNYGLTHNTWLLGDEQGLGKALALNTKIYTPDGYKLMGQLNVGDYVFGKDGNPTKVIAVYDHTDVEMYRITFSDGVSIECCKDHLWQIHDQHGIKVVSTSWFTEKDQFGNTRADSLFSKGSGSYKYWIDRCSPVEFERREIAIDSYLMGVLLGDGCLTGKSITFSSTDTEIINEVSAIVDNEYTVKHLDRCNYCLSGVKGKRGRIKETLNQLGLLGKDSHTKFIPDNYKYNSVDVRLAVLQGLLDTDGYATSDNLIQYTSVSKRLCDDVRFLVESLGGIANLSEKPCGYNGRVTGIAYTLTIRFDEPQKYFRLTRKKCLLHTRKFKARRNIVKIERIPNANARCISVDNADKLYLAEHFVVTHNTWQVINIALARRQMYGYKHCLIICGVNGLKWNWSNEIKTHSDEQGYILGQRVNKKGRVVIKGNADKLSDIERIDELPYFIITNIESMRDEKIAGALKVLCDTKVIDMIAFDECHKAKNPTSQQSKGVLKLSAESMIAMTGTPLLNTPLDLYMPLKWLGYEKHSFYAFKNHYCIMGGYGNYQIMGYKNTDELRAQLSEMMLRRLKKDVLDLPEKLYVDEYVEMDKEQARIYAEVLADLRDKVDKIAQSPNPLSQLIRLRQATGYTGILSSEVQVSAKMDRMEDLVEEAVANGKKVVVFSNWVEMTDVILERVAKYNPATITGRVKDSDTELQKKKFQEDDTCKVIVGTTPKMGVGYTLTAGTVVIFLDLPWTNGDKEQAIDRCHRIGTVENITVYTLLTKDTIDERVNEIVKSKKALSDDLIDGMSVQEKKDLVNFLLS